MKVKFIITTVITSTLMLTACSQLSTRTVEQQAEDLAIKACAITEVTEEDTGELVLQFEGMGQGTWDQSGPIDVLREIEQSDSDMAKYATRAARLDAYWAPLARNLEIMYEYISTVVRLRLQIIPGIEDDLWGAGKERFLAALYDADTTAEDYIQSLQRWELECEALYDTLRERE